LHATKPYKINLYIVALMNAVNKVFEEIKSSCFGEIKATLARRYVGSFQYSRNWKKE